ncbi:MAG: arginine--tRNA ligase [bacterium]
MDNSLKSLIEDYLRESCRELKRVEISLESFPSIFINRPKRKEWGDLSTSLPFSLSRKTGKSTSGIGRLLTSYLKEKTLFSQVEFAPPGFINFSISSAYLNEVLKKIVTQKEEFTGFSYGKGRRIQVEFVSANPTGPLHVGHGRAAAFGDSLANILSKVGYEVEREYYINNIGGQIERLSRSIWARLQQLEGEEISFPEDGYQGQYLIDIAKEARIKLGDKLSEKERPKEQLIRLLAEFTLKKILRQIKTDLDKFGVRFDRWFFESSLNKEIPKVISFMKNRGYVYEKDGALWFKTSSFLPGKKDRVLRRRSGEYTYFASDIAYHAHKFNRGLDQVIDVWGSDHIGYVPRMKAAVEALGYPKEVLKIIVYQLVTLKRGDARISASTREGKFIPLREVLEEVGKDAARFFFLSRTCDSHLDFDLELAKKQTPENPVFYIQYAHARISSILEKAKDKGIKLKGIDEVRLDLLVSPEERELMKELTLLPDEIKEAAESLEPHRLTTYLMGLATIFHQFYTRHRVISGDKELTGARLLLIKAVKIALKDTLNLLGITAPQKM